jgi:hypothetical protein
VTYCTNCRDSFASIKREAWHILDLLFSDDSQNRAKRNPPSISQRKQNRILLKKTILKEVLGEDMNIEKRDFENINLIISDQLLQKLERNFNLG